MGLTATSWLEAIQKYGATTVFACVLLGFVLWQNHSVNQQTHVIRQKVDSVLEKQAASESRLLLLETEQARRIGVLEDYATQIRENNRRITRREDNQFTARDGSRLQMLVQGNANNLASLAQAVARAQEQVNKVAECMHKLERQVDRLNVSAAPDR